MKPGFERSNVMVKKLKVPVSTALLIGILLLALFFRLNLLGRIPPGMTDDELREAYSASAIWHTGHDLTRGLFLPFTFVVNNFSFSPVPIYIAAPFVGILGITPFSARLPFALAGVLSVLFTYIAARRLTRQQPVALFSAFVMSSNVWAIQISRLAHEAIFAQMFYLAGICVFLTDWRKKAPYYVGVSGVLLFLAFNSYDATKILYLPILIVLCMLKRKEFKKRNHALIIIVSCAVITFGIFSYLFLFQKAGVHGSAYTVFQNVESGQSVELARRASSAPELLKVLFHNKVTYYLDIFLHHFLYVFSPDFLFLNQEASGVLSLWLRGNLYYIELPLLLLGMVTLSSVNLPIFFFCVSLMFIGALPAGIGPEPFTYATRASFVLPWLTLFIGAGAIYLVNLVKKKLWKVCVIVLIASLYVYVIGGYLSQYYFEWSINNAAYFSKGTEDLIAYVSPLMNRYKTFEVANVNDTFVLHWALFNHTDVRKLQVFYKLKNQYEFQPVKILLSCKNTGTEDPRMTMDTGEIYAANPSCHSQTADHIITLPDGSPQWAVYVRSRVAP